MFESENVDAKVLKEVLEKHSIIQWISEQMKTIYEMFLLKTKVPFLTKLNLHNLLLKYFEPYLKSSFINMLGLTLTLTLSLTWKKCLSTLLPYVYIKRISRYWLLENTKCRETRSWFSSYFLCIFHIERRQKQQQQRTPQLRSPPQGERTHHHRPPGKQR